MQNKFSREFVQMKDKERETALKEAREQCGQSFDLISDSRKQK